MIILVWTPPHFWAPAIHRRDDYARAAIPMLHVTHGVTYTARSVLQYSVALWALGLLPCTIGMSGWPYGTAATLLGARFVWMARGLGRDERLAMPTFRYSIAYLGALFTALLADHALTTALPA